MPLPSPSLFPGPYLFPTSSFFPTMDIFPPDISAGPRSPHSDWKFELARSKDLERIGELTQARGRNLTLTLNKAGSLTFQVPLRDPLSYEIEEAETAVVLSFQNQPVWSGMVWNTAESIAAGSASMSVTAIGWLQTLEKRLVRPGWNGGQPVTYTDYDAGKIAMALLERSNLDAFISSAPIYLVPGTYEETTVRTRTYQVWSNVLQAITELSEVENGYDLYVDPVTRALNIVGIKANDTDAHYEVGVNVRQFQRQSDVGRLANAQNAYSAAGVGTVVDTSSMSRYGLFEEAQSLSDVVETDILTAYAAAEIYVKSRPLRIATFQPMPYSLERPNDPRPFRDFDVGDIVYLTARDIRHPIDRQAHRLFSYSISFGENGVESVGNVQAVAA